mgnify:CR=1 FL=1
MLRQYNGIGIRLFYGPPEFLPKVMIKLRRMSQICGHIQTPAVWAANEGVNKAVMREAVAIQMTWVGAPTIYYGDEAGAVMVSHGAPKAVRISAQIFSIVVAMFLHTC